MGTEEHELPDVPDLSKPSATPAPFDERASRIKTTAVRLDSQPGLLAAARRLRRRLPGDEKFGDPLSTAGETPIQVV
ncbi:MAG TPA: hypothetical protein VGX45_14685, partial [Solirubrobacteraceae bacterium]|nr:hypothetical protein [Solirubrobacteraceae bacterium]